MLTVLGLIFMSSHVQKNSDNYHHGHLRHALLSTARILLEESGANRLNLREIARRVGVSAPSVYHHFSKMDSLTAALAEEGFKELLEEMEDTIDSQNNRTRTIGENYILFACNNPGLYRLMFGDIFRKTSKESDHIKTLRQKTKTHLLRKLRHLPEDEMEIGAIYLWSVVHGLALLLIDQQVAPSKDRDEMIQKVLKLSGSGLLLSSVNK